jgi:hypothetical protein
MAHILKLGDESGEHVAVNAKLAADALGVAEQQLQHPILACQLGCVVGFLLVDGLYDDPNY